MTSKLRKRARRAAERRQSLALAAGMAQRVTSVRLSLGHDEKTFANMLGVPTATVRRCEAGQLIQTARVLALAIPLCDLANVTLDWLICGRGPVGLCKVAKTGNVAFLGARQRKFVLWMKTGKVDRIRLSDLIS